MVFFSLSNNKDEIELLKLGVPNPFVQRVGTVLVKLHFETRCEHLFVDLSSVIAHRFVHHYYHRLKKSYVLQNTQKRMLKTCRGDNQKGHLPPKFSVKIAVIRSSEPIIARWIITGGLAAGSH
jgi:hypothetical protein